MKRNDGGCRPAAAHRPARGNRRKAKIARRHILPPWPSFRRGSGRWQPNNIFLRARRFFQTCVATAEMVAANGKRWTRVSLTAPSMQATMFGSCCLSLRSRMYPLQSTPCRSPTWIFVSGRLAFYLLKKLLERPKIAQLPPGPKPYPIIGNLLDIAVGRAWIKYTSFKDDYGACFVSR